MTDLDRAGPSTRVALGRAVLVGVMAGLASGLFGVGGGIVIVPGLVMLAGLDQRMAHGTSLAAIVPIALVGALGYATAGEVELVVSVLMAVGAVCGAPVGVAMLNRLPQRTLRTSFAAVLVLTAGRMVVAVPDGQGMLDLHPATVLGLLSTGVLAGMLSGLMGVGGGVLVVPVLTIVFGLPLVTAKGTSLAVIVPTALVGTWRNVRRGSTAVGVGTTVGLGGVVTAAAASQVSLGLDPGVSAWSFAVLLVATAGRMAWRARST